MKALELENYGVMEMNHVEVQKTDGGGSWLKALGMGPVSLGAYIVWEVITNPCAHSKAASSGYKSGTKAAEKLFN